MAEARNVLLAVWTENTLQPVGSLTLPGIFPPVQETGAASSTGLVSLLRRLIQAANRRRDSAIPV